MSRLYFRSIPDNNYDYYHISQKEYIIWWNDGIYFVIKKREKTEQWITANRTKDESYDCNYCSKGERG